MGGDGHETEQVSRVNRSSASSKSTRRGCQPQSSAASTGSAARRFTSGGPSTAAWRYQTPWKLKGLEDENRAPEEAAGGIDAGCGDAARATCKKLLTPRLRRKAVAWAMTETSHSQRRASALVADGSEDLPLCHRGGRTTPASASGCGNWPRSRTPTVRLSAVCTSCWPGKASGSIIKSSIAGYREERLTVRKRGGRKRALGTRAPLLLPWNRNQRWSLDFVADALAESAGGSASWRWWTTSSRECLAASSSTHRCLASAWLGSWTAFAELRGRPRMLVSDNGTELTSNAILRWQQELRRWLATTSLTGQARAKRLCSRDFNGRLREHDVRRGQRTSLRRPGRSAADHRGMEVRLATRTLPAHEPGLWLTPNEFAARPNWGHNLKRFYL